MAIYDDATPRTDVLTSGSGDFTTLAWGADATTLFGQSDSEVDPQTLSGLAVSPSGVSLTRTLNRGGLGTRIHFDTGTNLLYSDSGVITNPEDRAFLNPGPVEPQSQRADRASVGARPKGQAYISSGAFLVCLRLADGDDSAVC